MICSTIRPRAAEETLKRAGDRPGLRVQRLFVTRNNSPRSQKITGASKPSTTQDGLIDSCISFHQAGKGETYAKIISNFGTFDFDTFFKWNPAVNADCSGIWAGYYYCNPAIGKNCESLLTNYWVCVGVVGWSPPTKTTTTKAATTTKPSNGISTPLPIQANMAGYNVCVGVIGGTPTKPSDGIKTPSPIQPKMTTNCKKFHKVASTTTCASIQKYYKITMAQLLKWNPTVGSGCEKLWADYWVCVGV
ncbi:hypothetical protein HG531_010623 [Fusarium graminearum]|nr:hypothetical protein HG531_010623 [Fusarium graminearum]